MSRTLRSLVALSCLAAAGHALAAELDTRLYVSPGVNYTATDRDWGMDDDFGFGIGIGRAISPSLNLELNANYGEYSINNVAGSVKNTGLGVDALYFFNRNPDFAPYALIGVGGVQTRAPGISETNLAGNVGLGFMKWVNDVAVRADVRYRHISDVGSIDANDWIVTAGLAIPLGAKPVPPAPKPAPAPQPAPVPAPVPAPAPPPPVVGPEKPAFEKVTLQAESLFDFDKAVVREDGKKALNDEVVTKMKLYPQVEVVLVTGHADRIGKESYNQNLSERRAAAVKDYLVSQGIDAGRIKTAGKGESEPVVACSDVKGKETGKNRQLVECLQPNRRVVVEVEVQRPTRK